MAVLGPGGLERCTARGSRKIPDDASGVDETRQVCGLTENATGQRTPPWASGPGRCTRERTAMVRRPGVRFAGPTRFTGSRTNAVFESACRRMVVRSRAGVAKLADARDSKSRSLKRECGFDSLLRHLIWGRCPQTPDSLTRKSRRLDRLRHDLARSRGSRADRTLAVSLGASPPAGPPKPSAWRAFGEGGPPRQTV